MSGVHRRYFALASAAALCAQLLVSTADAAAAPATASTASSQDCRLALRFARADFPRRPKIDNRWLPLVPGTRSVLSGTVTGDDGKQHAHTIRSTVSGVTKVLDGVRTVVVFERDYEDGLLQESELSFQAQDSDGNVWNVGEYPEEYEDGGLAGAPSTWIAGIAGAKAGLSMQARPRLGSPAYLQGLAASVDFRDCARVAKIHQRVSTERGCFSNVLVMDEWAPLEPEGGHQLKYYAPGVGPVRVGAVGGNNPEVLKLTGHSKLDRATMKNINSAVIAQDHRGYRVSPKVYGHTQPARVAG